ncbi:MAG: ThuA domain-containing protein [Pseudomonadota bacterium]
MSKEGSKGGPIRVHLIVGAPTHDTNYVRLELLKALHENPHVCVTIGDDFSDVGKIAAAQALVVYSCNVSPDDAQLDALEEFVEGGGRLFAMHATNALIRFTDGPPIIAQGIQIPGQVDTTDTNPRFTRLLGSRFLAHLLLGPMHVEVTETDSGLLSGLAAFDVVDEPYVVELTGPAEVLLTARFGGRNPGYVLSDWPEADYPQMYLRGQGEGEVLYLNLGHSSGRYDFLPLMDEGPVSRGPWETDGFRAVLRRSLDWVTRA